MHGLDRRNPGSGALILRRFGIDRFQRDARLFLVTTFVAGAALSLYWIDFNLYLASLGLSTSTIGIISTVAAFAGALVAFPASAASDRYGRRAIVAAGILVGRPGAHRRLRRVLGDGLAGVPGGPVTLSH
jgi:MFS family permease